MIPITHVPPPPPYRQTHRHHHPLTHPPVNSYNHTEPNLTYPECLHSYTHKYTCVVRTQW